MASHAERLKKSNEVKGYWGRGVPTTAYHTGSVALTGSDGIVRKGKDLGDLVRRPQEIKG